MALDLTDVDLAIAPSPDAQPFWDGVAAGELVLPWCVACDTPFWYPRSICPACGGRDIDWREASGRGVVHAFCIHHSSPLPHMRLLLPVVTVLTELDEGVRVMGLLDAEPEPGAVACGLAVHVELRPSAQGRLVPIFVPSTQTDR